MIVPAVSFRSTALAFALAAVLTGCGGDSAQQAAGVAPVASTTPAAAAPVVAEETVEALMRRANVAFREDRIVNPAGDNATELFLAVRERAPDQPGLAEALVEIMPLANFAFESALRQRDAVECERLLTLIARINDQSNITLTARNNLDALKARLAAEQQSLADAAAAPAAAASPREATAKVSTPARSDTSAPALAKIVATAPDAGTSPSGKAPGQRAADAPAQPIAAADAVDNEPAPTASAATINTPSASALTAPIAVAKVAPDYPPQARSRKVEGFVELEFLVTATGRPEAIRVVRSEPEGLFDRNAVRALMRWKFKPAERNGVPEQTTTRTTINFRQS